MTTEIRYQDRPWVSHYDNGVPDKIQFKEILVSDFLSRTVGKFPNNPALIFQGYGLSFRELDEMVNRFATCLSDFGIQKGDRVAILLPNLIPCVAAYYAIMRLGAVAVMNNPLYTDTELEHQFNDSGAKLLITLDLLVKRMVALRPKTAIQKIIYTSIGDYLPFPKNLLFPLVAKKKKLAAKVTPAPDLHHWKALIKQYPPTPPSVDVAFDDTAMLQYTGGTTGLSKGVILTHRNLSSQIQQAKAWFPHLPEGAERALGALPFFHIFGLTVSMNLAVFMGWANILVPKPQPEPLLEAIGKFKPTFAPLVPTMFIGMLNHPGIGKTDMSSIKGCFSGSAPLPVEIIKEFEEKSGGVIVEGFGLTESSPVTHVNPFSDGKRKVGSVGVPLPDTGCRIVDLSDKITDMPIGESGELLVKGPQVMKGYWNREGETEKTLVDGWLHTGDIAMMDEEGYVYIVDRIKDMVISGGYNVYPRDIDEVLYEHPKVQEACAIGIPHPTRGEAIKVFVVLKENEMATQEELIEFCKGKLARYKLPTEVEFREDLPKSTVGKVLRKDLRTEEEEKRS